MSVYKGLHENISFCHKSKRFHFFAKEILTLRFPSLEREGNVSQAILLWSLGCLPFYKRLFHIPLQSSWGALPLSMRSFIILSYFLTYKDGLRLMVGASLRSTLTASFSLRDFPQYAFRSSSVSWSCGKGITSGMVPSG